MNNIDIIQYIYVYLLLIAPVAENCSLQPWTPATFWVSHLKIAKIAHDNGVIRSLAGRRTQNPALPAHLCISQINQQPRSHPSNPVLNPRTFDKWQHITRKTQLFKRKNPSILIHSRYVSPCFSNCAPLAPLRHPYQWSQTDQWAPSRTAKKPWRPRKESRIEMTLRPIGYRFFCLRIACKS